MSFTWRSVPHQQWNAKPLCRPTRDHTYSSCRFFIWEKALAWTDMMALSLKSLRRGEKKEKWGKGAMAKAMAACFPCQHQPYSVKATKTSIEVREGGRRKKKKKGLGSRTIKLWAAVCCVNQERPNSALLWALAMSGKKLWLESNAAVVNSHTHPHTSTHTHTHFPLTCPGDRYSLAHI